MNRTRSSDAPLYVPILQACLLTLYNRRMMFVVDSVLEPWQHELFLVLAAQVSDDSSRCREDWIGSDL